jgi:hypothetical protein
MKKTIFAALGLIWAVASADAQQFSADEITRRTIERRAIEAVVWGIRAVNYDLMLQEMLKLGGKANQIIYWSRLPDWKNQTLTPNPDTHLRKRLPAVFHRPTVVIASRPVVHQGSTEWLRRGGCIPG